MGQGDGSSVSVNGRQVYGKGQWREEVAATRGHHGRRRGSQKYKEEKMERRKAGDIGQLVTGSHG